MNSLFYYHGGTLSSIGYSIGVVCMYRYSFDREHVHHIPKGKDYGVSRETGEQRKRCIEKLQLPFNGDTHALLQMCLLFAHVHSGV